MRPRVEDGCGAEEGIWSLASTLSAPERIEARAMLRHFQNSVSLGIDIG